MKHSVFPPHPRTTGNRVGPMRPALLEVIAQAETDAGSDEACFLEQLRAAVAGVETPADRLFARYRGRPSGPARPYGEYRD